MKIGSDAVRKSRKKAAKTERYLKGKARDVHFKSWKAWRSFTAFLHANNIPHHQAHSVVIAGHKHSVNCENCKK